MMDEKAPIKIVIPIEEEPPYLPEQPRPRLSERAQKLGGRVAVAAKRGAQAAWQSRVRKKATGSLRRGVTAIVKKGSRLAQDKLVKRAERRAKESASALRTRIGSTEWKLEAKAGTAKGLRWASRQLTQLADRFTPIQENPPE